MNTTVCITHTHIQARKQNRMCAGLNRQSLTNNRTKANTIAGSTLWTRLTTVRTIGRISSPGHSCTRTNQKHTLNERFVKKKSSTKYDSNGGRKHARRRNQFLRQVTAETETARVSIAKSVTRKQRNIESRRRNCKERRNHKEKRIFPSDSDHCRHSRSESKHKRRAPNYGLNVEKTTDADTTNKKTSTQ